MRCGDCKFWQDDDQCKINFGVCEEDDEGCPSFKVREK